MAEKLKRRHDNLRKLYFLERFLYWVSWLGLMATFFFALREANHMREITLGSQPMFHTFYGLIWFPFITGMIGIVIGSIPTVIAFLMSQLLRWALRLEDENRAQQELIQTLMRERDEAERSQRLIEQEKMDEPVSDDDLYEQTYIRR